jgi:hypothetical protein
MKLTILSAAFIMAVPPFIPIPVEAAPLLSLGVVPQMAPEPVETVQHRRGGAVRGGFVARGPRGGTVVRHGTAAARPGYRPVPVRSVRPVPVPVRPGWVRPSGYWWRPGAAVAAGAALGFITAAAATSYVTAPPPAPGYCWYYTNPQRTQGFWDVCPR